MHDTTIFPNSLYRRVETNATRCAFCAPKPYATLPDDALLSGNLPICCIPFQPLKQKQTVSAKHNRYTLPILFVYIPVPGSPAVYPYPSAGFYVDLSVSIMRLNGGQFPSSPLYLQSGNHLVSPKRTSFPWMNVMSRGIPAELILSRSAWSSGVIPPFSARYLVANSTLPSP